MPDDKIFGYEWNDIVRAQRGGAVSAKVDTTRPSCRVDEDQTKQDRELLEQHGRAGLEAQGLRGVIDRLTRANAW